MPTSKKPRKKYRSPHTDVRPGHIKLFRFGKDSEYWLKSQPHQALEAMRTGTATDDDFDAVSLRVLWCAQMIRDHIIETEPMDIAIAGVKALEAVHERYERIGRVGVSGEEFRLLGDAINLADDLQSTLTRREMEQSFRTVMGKRNQQIRARA